MVGREEQQSPWRHLPAFTAQLPAPYQPSTLHQALVLCCIILVEGAKKLETSVLFAIQSAAAMYR
jgi:hypothetical protein